MNRLSIPSLLCVLLVAYLGANACAVPILQGTLETQCVNSGWFVYCHFNPDEDMRVWANAALVLMSASLIIALYGWARESIVYPFGMLVCGITLLVVAIDAVAKRGVLSHDRLVNDSLNAMSIVLLGSFILIITLASARRLPVMRLALAIVASFAVKVLAMLLFGVIEIAFRGPVELWLLYGIFMWMVFGLHLMSISIALANIDNRLAPAGDVA